MVNDASASDLIAAHTSGDLQIWLSITEVKNE